MVATQTHRKTRRSRIEGAVTTTTSTPVEQPLHADVAGQESAPANDVLEEEAIPSRSLEELPTDEAGVYEWRGTHARASTQQSQPQPLIIESYTASRASASATAITERDGEDEQSDSSYHPQYSSETRQRHTAWARTERATSFVGRATGPRRLRKRTFPTTDIHVFWQEHWQKFALGMLLMVALILLWGVGSLLWTTLSNQLTYGFPRTTQLDAVLGDQDSVAHPSHLVVLNLHGQIELVVFPGGDATHAQVLLGPRLTGPAADQATVTVRVADTNHDGKPDLIVQITGAPQFLSPSPTMTLVARNNGKGFAPFVLAQQQ